MPDPIYRLTRYRSSADPACQAALALYASQIPEAGQTGLDEMRHWVDQGGQVSTTTQAHCCGFSIDDQLVGFAHWGVLGNGLANLDYLALHPSARTAAPLAHFLRLLTEAMLASGAVCVVTEVLQDPVLARFCRFSGFQLIEAPYFQPPMGEGDTEEGLLMVWGHTGPLTVNTYADWVRALYFDYYLPWHGPFLTEADRVAYAAHLDTLLAHTVAALPGPTIALKGKGHARQD